MIFLLLACAPKPVAPTAPTLPPSVSAETVKIHMSMNFTTAVAARDAVLAGNVEGAQARLAKLGAVTDLSLIAEAGVPFLSALQAAAKTGEAATTVSDLGTVIGSVSLTCGNCHTHFNAGLSPAVASPPTPGGSHAAASTWLVDALWTGVVANADTAWTTGAAALAANPKDLAGYGVTTATPAAQDALNTLATQVAAAPVATTGEARASTLGKVVGACGACHAARRTD